MEHKLEGDGRELAAELRRLSSRRQRPTRCRSFFTKPFIIKHSVVQRDKDTTLVGLPEGEQRDKKNFIKFAHFLYVIDLICGESD